MNSTDLLSGESSDEVYDDSTSSPQSYIVIAFSKHIQHKTLTWLVKKIKAKRHDGGAELIIRQQPYDQNEGIVLHISASKIKLLEAAEEMELMKKDRNGQLREFSVNQLEDFLEEGMSVDDLFTFAERQTIVRHELENIRALDDDSHLPGYYTYMLYEGQSIINACLKRKLILKIYPLHDKERLKKLARTWYLNPFKKQPFEDIREYFGEAITLYFTFIEFYTSALLFPMILGFLQYFVSTETMPFFCVFNVIWTTIFLELWRRRSNELAYTWGTITMTSLDEPRANFYGHIMSDPITGRMQPQYPRWITNFKMYCVSFPIVILCMFIAFLVMLASFWCEDYIRSLGEDYSYFVYIPSIIYAILVYIMNFFYRKFATFMTEWENHRTQSQFERHRVSKLVLFEFVNNFMAMFYIAFVIQDMEMLRTQVIIMLIIYQGINHLTEVVIPLIIKYYVFKSHEKNKYFKLKPTNQPTSPLHDIPVIPEEETVIEEATKEGKMDVYLGTFDDYLELYIQFGYVVLFSSVYPIAALWAVLNNILEVRADAFKLCVLFQRPMNRRVKNIGAWQMSFEIVGALSIMTNCGLLALSPALRNKFPDISSDVWILYFLLLEHLLLGIRYILHKGIPEIPTWVRVQMAKTQWESKQALKHERAMRSKRFITRKYKTVHGPHRH